MTISLISIAAIMAFTMIVIGIIGIITEFRRQAATRPDRRQQEHSLARIYTNHR